MSLDPSSWGEVLCGNLLDEASLSFISKPSSCAIVSSAYPFAVHAGLQALRLGGSAADAAITTALTQLALSGGAYVNLMGVGMAVVHRASDRRCLSIHGGYQVPRYERAAEPTPASGGRTVLTPGFPACLLELHRCLGRLPWNELFLPSLWLTEQGFPAGKRLAASIWADRDRLRLMDGASEFFQGNGQPLGPYHVFRQPSLHATLARLAKVGLEDCYRGETARRLVATVQAGGGGLNLEDLSGYQAIVSEALQADIWGCRIATLGQPGLGGKRLVKACQLMERLGTELGRFDSAESAFWQVLCCRVAAQHPSLGLEQMYQILRTRPQTLWQGAEPSHSAAIVVADREGNVVNLLHSSNSTRDFGCSGLRMGGVVLPGSASFQWPAVKAVGPGGRVQDPTNPNLIFKGKQVAWASGVIGSNLDRAMSRHLLDLLYYRLDPSRATLRPCPGGPGVSLAERFDPGEYSVDFRSQVEKLGLPVESVEHATDNWVALESTEMGWVGHASRPELAWFAGDG